MLRATVSKLMWVGRGAAAVFGLALVFALVLGVGTMALAAAPGVTFRLGQTNAIDAMSTLVGSVAGPMLRVDNHSTAAGATALDLRVEEGQAPMKVNSATMVGQLNADKVDGTDATGFYAAGSKVSDSSHADLADSATSAGDANTLDDKDSTEFLGANQKAADSEKLDGLDSNDFAKAYKRTVLVSPVGTPTENGTALKNALGGISDASASNPYLLKIEPGIYDLGSLTGFKPPLNMKPYVDVEGSGEGVTTITAANTSVAFPTVVGAANSELRSLTVKSTGSGGGATAIENNASSFRLTSVTAAASGGNETAALLVSFSSTTMVNQTTLTASGPIYSSGISGGGDVQVLNSRISSRGDVRISSPIDGGTVRVAASQLAGPSVQGEVTCAGVYDENFTFYANTCP